MSLFFIYLIIGALAGLLAGLLGIGGGVIIIPALSQVFLSHQIVPSFYVMQMAIGTSLAIIIITTLSALNSHQQRKAVRWDWVKRMLPGVIIGAMLGATISHYLSSVHLRQIFGVFILYVGFRMLLSRENLNPEKTLLSSYLIFVFSLFIGTLSSIIGVGGGVLLIPFLMYCCLEARQIPGTTVACGFVLAIVATLSLMVSGMLSPIHVPMSLGYIYLPAFLGIALSSLFFAPMGATLAHRLPTKILKRVFGLFLLVMSVDMLFF